MTAPRDVAVVIPTCSRPQMLERALLSVEKAALHAQVTGRVEIVVVDDGHDAQAQETCTRVAARIALPIRIARTARGPAAGPAAARNQGVRLSHGAFIFLLDDDDVFIENRFVQSLALLSGGAWDVVLEPTRRMALDGSRPPWLTGPYGQPSNAFRFLMEGAERSHVTPAATSFTRDAFERVGGYDEHLRYGEDGELLLRLCLSARVALLDGEPVAEYFVHTGNSSHPDRIAYWQNIRALTRLYAKVRANWPREKRYVADALSGKLDDSLSRIRRDSANYVQRLVHGLRCLRWFDWRCTSRRNLASIGVWLFKAKPTATAIATAPTQEKVDC